MTVEEVVECVEGEVLRWWREPKRPVRRDSVGGMGEVSWRERRVDVDEEAGEEVVVSWWKRGILLSQIKKSSW